MIYIALVNHICMIWIFICLIVKNVYEAIDIICVFTTEIMIMRIKIC